MSNNVLSLKERLTEIVDISYRVLCNKIVSQSINIPNEASLQLQLGVILKQVGQLYEFSTEDRFIIQLEDVQDINATQKSKNGKARCDIMLTLENGVDKSTVAIELKHFKKASKNSSSETITDNRFSIWCDLENLENYKEVFSQKNQELIGYEILYTNNPNYANPGSTSYVKLGHGIVMNPGEYESNGRKVTLRNEYTFNWDIYPDDNCFLKIKV